MMMNDERRQAKRSVTKMVRGTKRNATLTTMTVTRAHTQRLRGRSTMFSVDYRSPLRLSHARALPRQQRPQRIRQDHDDGLAAEGTLSVSLPISLSSLSLSLPSFSVSRTSLVSSSPPSWQNTRQHGVGCVNRAHGEEKTNIRATLKIARRTKGTRSTKTVMKRNTAKRHARTARTMT